MLDRIRTQLSGLSVAERKVAELALAQPYTMMKATVAEISANAGVSQPTVIRFSRTMRCSGLTEFKQQLASSLINGVPYVHSKVLQDDPAAEIAPKVFDSTISALIKCRDEVNPARVEQAVDLVSGQRGGRLVEHQNVGLDAERARDGDQRLLGAAQIAHAHGRR